MQKAPLVRARDPQMIGHARHNPGRGMNVFMPHAA
jgi:hypothetical protein